MSDLRLSKSWTGPSVRTLKIELLVIDLTTCARCVPTGAQLEKAVELLSPAAVALGIDLRMETKIVQTREEALLRGLLSSPTIRINGRDIAQDVRESKCESCGDLVEDGDLVSGGTSVDCREWHYKGKAYSAAPLPLLVEAVMGAMLSIDSLRPVKVEPLIELPENLVRFFENKKDGSAACCV